MRKEIGVWSTDVAQGEFPEKVLEPSKERPVLVDFWATWCGPCRVLTPVLEKLVQEFGGAFLLARVNTEEAPALALQFNIQSIPLVILFRDGAVVDQFIGALPEEEVRGFLRRHCRSPADEVIGQANDNFKSADLEAAERSFRQVLSEQPAHPGALLGLAKVAWKRRKPEEMQSYLRNIDPLSPEAEEGETLNVRVRFQELCQEFGGVEACHQRRAQETEDLESRYRLAVCLAAGEQYQEALEVLLGIVTSDREFRDEAPRKAMLDVFNIIGNRSQLAEEYRTRLSRTIF